MPVNVSLSGVHLLSNLGFTLNLTAVTSAVKAYEAAFAANASANVTIDPVLLSVYRLLNVTSNALVVDEAADLKNILWMGLPFLAFLAVLLMWVSYYTDEDGFVHGARKIESDDEFVYYRWFNTAMTYCLEGTQIAAVAFGPASTRGIVGGAEVMDFLTGFLFNGGDYFVAFPAVVTLEIILIIFMLIPMVMWWTLKKEAYDNFRKVYVHGNFSWLIAFLQDVFMIWFTCPFFVTLTIFIPCEYFELNVPPKALLRTTACSSADHERYAVLGGLIALFALIVGGIAGSVPTMVERRTDIAINGRFGSIAFMVRAGLAIIWVLFKDNHPFIQLIAVLIGQIWLLYLNVSLRPCLVERINFHRSAAICLAMVPTITLIIASGLDDKLNTLPQVAGALMIAFMFVMILLKYYVFPCGKLFPALPYDCSEDETGGEYEGGLILGLALPQGHGVLRWNDAGKAWGGTFLFGKYHGYGVMTQYKYFFQGMHWRGDRDGFGVTNLLGGEDEDFYEGNWERGVLHGPGTKQFTNNDTYDGGYVDGLEHGRGLWSFDTALGRHNISTGFEKGEIAPEFWNGFSENEVYEGDLRFGVPHGLGSMDVDGTIFEGEWRAGKLHGNGTVTLPDDGGRYEGILLEGKFHDEGTWRDENETYTGKWVMGEKHGSGIQELASGTYEGMFVHDVRMGFGGFTYKDGTTYSGSWYDNNWHGAGTLTSSDGAEYEGFWAHGKRHGPRGKLTYPDGGSYYGNWDEDQFHGDGQLKIPQMGEFHGRFEFSKRNGNGRMTFFDGSEYVGEWLDDLPDGYGKFVFASRKAIKVLKIMSIEDASKLEVTGPKNILDFGGVFEGDFVTGTMHGAGSVKTGDGTIYEGDWADGFPEGAGRMVKPNGQYYEGAFAGGNPHGKGRMEYPDDRVYVGEFAEGKRHGQGVLYGADNEVIYDCEWINDVPEDMAGVKDAAEELRDAPTVDIDDLLRVIMPSSQTPIDLEQAAFRRRIELEERAFRFGLLLDVDEARTWRHTVRAFVTPVETAARHAIEYEFLAEAKSICKSNLAHILNQWKADFRKRDGREPKKSDLMKDPTISGAYNLYMNLAK